MRERSDAPIELNVKGPFGLTGKHDRILFQEPESSQSGIYFWTVPYVEGGYLVHYIGETGKSFGERQKEHMIHTMGGNYRIWGSNELGRGNSVIIWHGLWLKGTRDKMSDFLDQLPAIAPEIQKYLRSQVIFTAKVNAESRIRQRIEGAIALYFRGLLAPAASILPEEIRYFRRRESEKAVKVLIECPFPIHGMPKDLAA